MDKVWTFILQNIRNWIKSLHFSFTSFPIRTPVDSSVALNSMKLFWLKYLKVLSLVGVLAFLYTATLGPGRKGRDQRGVK